jgi:hypothetical protein
VVIPRLTGPTEVIPSTSTVNGFYHDVTYVQLGLFVCDSCNEQHMSTITMPPHPPLEMAYMRCPGRTARTHASKGTRGGRRNLVYATETDTVVGVLRKLITRILNKNAKQ